MVVFALCVRSLTYSMGDERIFNFGLWLGVVLSSVGYVWLNSKWKFAIAAGTVFGFLMCSSYALEMILHSRWTDYLRSYEYVRKNPTAAQYADDPTINTVAVIVLTLVSFLVATASVGGAQLFRRFCVPLLQKQYSRRDQLGN